MKLYSVKAHSDFSIPGNYARDILIDAHIPESETPLPVIIFSHGFKGFKDWGPFNTIARIFADAGFAFIKFNFSFNGTTPESPLDFTDLEAFGQNNFTKELDDLHRVIDWVINANNLFRPDLERISLLGHSRGGGITILKAAEEPRVAAAATWAAVADFSRFITEQDIADWKQTGVHFIENARTGQMMPLYLQLYHDFIHNQPRLHIKGAVSRITKPLLIVHGTADETVAVSHALELKEENPEMVSLLTIEGGDHTFGAAHPFAAGSLPPHFQQVVAETLRFFREV
jgi:dienelactone hydrolase